LVVCGQPKPPTDGWTLRNANALQADVATTELKNCLSRQTLEGLCAQVEMTPDIGMSSRRAAAKRGIT
jgi:hypothetical protein